MFSAVLPAVLGISQLSANECIWHLVHRYLTGWVIVDVDIRDGQSFVMNWDRSKSNFALKVQFMLVYLKPATSGFSHLS